MKHRHIAGVNEDSSYIYCITAEEITSDYCPTCGHYVDDNEWEVVEN